MIVDKELLLSDEQEIDGADTDIVSTNKIDLTKVRDIGAGEPLYVVITCDETVTACTNVTFKVCTASAENLTSDQEDIVSTPAIAVADLTAGRAPIVLAIPPLADDIEQRYLGLVYVSDTPSDGKFTAFVGIGPHTNIFT